MATAPRSTPKPAKPRQNAKPTPGKPPPQARPGVKVVLQRVDALMPYARNSRTHSDEQVTQLAASILEFGWTNPVLADAKGIIAGHGRILAARRLIDQGQTIKLPDGSPLPPGVVPVIDCTGWSDAKRRAYVIADNKLALNAGWDETLLASEMEDLATGGFNLDAIGFDADEITKLAAKLSGEGGTSVNIEGDRFIVLVDCGNEATQAALFEELSKREGVTCKLMN